MGASSSNDNQQNYESNITFYGWNSAMPSQRFVSNFTTSLAQQGCNANGNFSMIVHGWQETVASPWVIVLVLNLLSYRGGCVFFMDYSTYANASDYFQLVPHFSGVSAVLLKKVKQIGNYDQQFMFGFSFGSRLCIDVGLKVGNGLINRMDLCDPAGPGFDSNVDPKPAAKYVSCINTSNDKGTTTYNCQQNFRMGNCGNSQAAAGSYPLGSHGLCPYFYNMAFNYEFVPNNYYECSSSRQLKSLVGDVKMGYRGAFNRTLYTGDIFIATAKFPPYIVVNGTIDNQMGNLLQSLNSTCKI